MRSPLPRLYPLIVLIVLAGSTVWLERATREEENERSAESRSEPDFTAERARLISFDEQGRQRYELLADRITNYPLPGVTELDRPRLRYGVEGRELRLAAEKGEVLDGGTEVLLTGDVRGLRVAAPGSPEMTFASASLRIWPDDQRAETDEPVVLTRGAATAHAEGMKSDNLFGTLDLIGSVRVRMPSSARNTP
ncbi:LPS export ABC transporter periplasmic protein LptC [Aromatoleum sp.]|uniref:LPS export ABC transporter periplasmic protein LptC n=1 Tax=Aromatoleum sp. TaxID=2307007 RepID=UPI002FC8D971